jgi:hypothetical protein
MGRCCGGKNAGKPITVPRYLAGLGIFCGYHAAMHVLLRAASKPLPQLADIRDFHRNVFADELKEVLARHEINVGGLLTPRGGDPTCEVGIEVHEVPVDRRDLAA